MIRNDFSSVDFDIGVPKSPASGSMYKGIMLPREKARWVWMRLTGPAVAEVRTFCTRLRGIK